MAHRYIASQFPGSPPAGRFISLLGDAELDEGAIWEAVADPAVAHLGELPWVVDLNRQSLDRVVPDIAIERLQGMFAAGGWQVVTVKWGRLISGLFQQSGGAELRARLETMPNEEYQRVLRVRPAEVADRILGTNGSGKLRTLLSTIDPAELAAAIVFAYTIKGRELRRDPVTPSRPVSIPASLGHPHRKAWEPAFAQDLEWCLLYAMERVGVPGGTSSYFRLSTRPIDPALARVPAEPVLAERRRQQVRAGGYRLPAEHPPAEEDVTLVGAGAIMPETVAAAAVLAAEGVNAGVICLTSPDTVLDGHPHTLAFLAGVRGDRIRCLGVTEFGQSSGLDDAYRIHHIDTGSIVDAAMTMVGR